MAGITFEEFEKIEIRAGRVTRAEAFPEARTPAIKLWIDFGPDIGARQSSARLTDRYTPEGLLGRQVMAVVNLAPRRIAGFRSEVLVLGVADATGAVVLIGPDADVPDGGRLH